MSLPEGTPGSRTEYTVTIELTARELEAVGRVGVFSCVKGDEALVMEILKKIVFNSKKHELETPTAERDLGQKPSP